MTIFKLLQNPLVKAIGIGAVLYFALFYNKDNPESLAKRLSADNVKANIDVAKDKMNLIVTTISTAKEAKNSSQYQEPLVENQAEAHNDKQQNFTEPTKSDNKIVCGQEVVVSYVAFSEMAKELKREMFKKIFIGSKTDSLLEAHVMGMTEGEEKDVILSPDMKLEDKVFADLLKNHSGKIFIHIVVSSVNPQVNKNILCK